MLRRAVIVAAPAGGLIWILTAVTANGKSLAERTSSALEPIGAALGMDGVILFAFLIAIPANEIVVPTMLMVYTGAGMLTEIDSLGGLEQILVVDHGWTLLTAIAVMVFTVLHNPCSTTIWTMWKETLSTRWTVVGALMPLAVGLTATSILAQTVRLLTG